MTPGVWLEDLTWPDAAARLAGGAVVVVPIGARSKEHGHHLPMSTDYRVARALCDRIIAALPVVVAPVVDFGYYPAFLRYPGSQHLRAETFSALVFDILEGFIAQGVNRIAIVNTGVSTVPPLRIVVRDLYTRRRLRVPVADIERLGLTTRRRRGRQRLGGHADQFETATMLAIAPELVRLDQARPDYGNPPPESVFYLPTEFSSDPAAGLDYSETGARGDPSQATVEDGRALLDDMAAELIAGLRAVFADVAE